MAVKDLQARQGKIDITLEIVSKDEPREFEKFGKSGRVCNAKAKDDTGTITITLWNEDIDKVKVGDTIKIENGWVSEWQGELQLSTGKFGKMEVVESAEASPEASVTKDEAEETEILDGSKKEEGEDAVTADEEVEEEVIEEIDEKIDSE
ncbi:hypothetical protein GOV09_04495 [Candidatus Woesearchaeota archaeon]|nr:hypothetical protein [Candidatus Woesearchaeota archaeon]